MTEQLTAIILAAGLSRRMGKENKLLLPFGETTMLATTLSNILTARVGETLVVVGHEAEEVVENLSQQLLAFSYKPSVCRSQLVDVQAFQKFKVQFSIDLPLQTSNIELQTEFTILMNNHYEKGMTTTIQTGVEAASAASLGYMICLSDMPFIAPAEYQFLAEQFLRILADDPQAIVQPKFEGKRGNPTIFSAFYRKEMLGLTYSEGCKPIVQAHSSHVYLVEMPSGSVLRDIDSKEEYARIG
jgi:molybdenum cofactor cytidylyltransferase